MQGHGTKLNQDSTVKPADVATNGRATRPPTCAATLMKSRERALLVVIVLCFLFQLRA